MTGANNFLKSLKLKIVKVSNFVSPNSLAEQLARVAESQIGVTEDAKHLNLGDSTKYQKADNLDGEGYAWCASFVSWCLQQLPQCPFSYPRIALAFAFEAWGRKSNLRVIKGDFLDFIPDRGDIVIYNFSHIGIVIRKLNPCNFTFQSVEGNTNQEGGREGYGVFRKTRSYKDVRCFIRIE